MLLNPLHGLVCLSGTTMLTGPVMVIVHDMDAGTVLNHIHMPCPTEKILEKSGRQSTYTHFLAWKLNLEENVANVWPQFGVNGKDQIKVHHVLNHTSGLHNALAGLTQENPLLMLDWDECLSRTAMSVPETQPGCEQLYHYLSFGWLCGGIIEFASGKKFQEILEEAIVHPLNIDGELYIGIPPGVESRLASLTVDTHDMKKLSGISNRSELPSSLQPSAISQLATTLPALFNTLNVRRAIIPAANGHCSARALARYYASLVDGGVVPPPHSSSSKPPLGSHPHIPKFSSLKSNQQQQKGGGLTMKLVKAANCWDTSEQVENPSSPNDGDYSRKGARDPYIKLATNASSSSNNLTSLETVVDDGDRRNISKIFSNTRIHDAFLGAGEYQNLILPSGRFGLGFRKYYAKDGSLVGFGHSGMGGSTGYCDIKNRFAIAVTLNKMAFGAVTGNIVHLVCSELGLPVPEEYSIFAERGPEMQLNLEKPLIN